MLVKSLLPPPTRTHRPWGYDSLSDTITIVDDSSDTALTPTPLIEPIDKDITEILNLTDRYGSYWEEYEDGLEDKIAKETFLEFPPWQEPSELTTTKDYYRSESSFAYPQFLWEGVPLTFGQPYGGMYFYRPRTGRKNRAQAYAYAASQGYSTVARENNGRTIWEKISTFYPMLIFVSMPYRDWTADETFQAYCKDYVEGVAYPGDGYAINSFFLGLANRRIPTEDIGYQDPYDWPIVDQLIHIASAGIEYDPQNRFNFGTFQSDDKAHFLAAAYAERRNTYPNCANEPHIDGEDLGDWERAWGWVKEAEYAGLNWFRLQGGQHNCQANLGYYVEVREFLEVRWQKRLPRTIPPPLILGGKSERGDNRLSDMLSPYAPKLPCGNI
jgi:hypothetical protein